MVHIGQTLIMMESERTDLPGARIIHDVAVHDGKVYAVGETEWE